MADQGGEAVRLWRKREYPPWMPPVHCPRCGRKIRYHVMEVSVEANREWEPNLHIQARVQCDHQCRRSGIVVGGVAP